MEKQDSVDHTVDVPMGVAYFRENRKAPVRILVSTATHLVPGNSFIERIRLLQNFISQYHWGCDFKKGDRFESYNAEFDFDNRAYYFVLDYGQSPDSNDDKVPILCIRVIQELPSRIQKKLKTYPFTPPTPIARPRCQLDAVQRREDICAKLRYNIRILSQTFDFLKENMEHLAWLERNLESALWLKFKSLKAIYDKFESPVARGIITLVPAQTGPGKGEKPKDCTER
ncbi:hypothetical protein B0O99DRAFT_602086 [Bisporella sp. PMI_857]|nr:hypothetical protein B0O99DRAFT_602086 [Bisporella sp. PMI_857]